jgi:hypothetical protein
MKGQRHYGWPFAVAGVVFASVRPILWVFEQVGSNLWWFAEYWPCLEQQCTFLTAGGSLNWPEYEIPGIHWWPYAARGLFGFYLWCLYCCMGWMVPIWPRLWRKNSRFLPAPQEDPTGGEQKDAEQKALEASLEAAGEAPGTDLNGQLIRFAGVPVVTTLALTLSLFLSDSPGSNWCFYITTFSVFSMIDWFVTTGSTKQKEAALAEVIGAKAAAGAQA